MSTDKEFAAKAADVVGLYLNPPEKALVISVDEKPSIQAMERKTGEARRLTRFGAGRTAAFTWSRDGSRLVANRFVDDAWNLWDVPASGEAPRRLTEFRSGQIFDFKWSSDGRDIVLSQGEAKRDAVLITGFH